MLRMGLAALNTCSFTAFFLEALGLDEAAEVCFGAGGGV